MIVIIIVIYNITPKLGNVNFFIKIVIIITFLRHNCRFCVIWRNIM